MQNFPLLQIYTCKCKFIFVNVLRGVNFVFFLIELVLA